MDKKNTQKGFTIIELMIATTIFSTILLVAASGVIAIGRMYYKGITSSRTQETARSIIDTISRTVQFSGNSMSDDGITDIPGVAQSVCFGYDRYTYVIDSKIIDTDTIGLRYNRRTDLNACTPLSSGGSELLPKNTRLLDFQITSLSTSNYRIKVKVAYGDNDLLTHYPPNATEATAPDASPASGLCRGGIAGSNFCATSELETIVNKRVE